MWIPRYFRMRSELRRISEAERKLDARSPQDPYEVERYNRQFTGLFEWKQLILTRYWEEKASNLGLPSLDWEDKSLRGQVDWDDDEDQPWYLTPKGIDALKERVRTEERHRREVRGYWFGIVIGLIGALTGLASVLKD